MKYQLTRSGDTVILHNEDGTMSHIPANKKNEDYQAYLAWVDAGGVAEQYSE